MSHKRAIPASAESSESSETRLSETSDIMRTNLACHAFSCLAVYSVSSLYVDSLTCWLHTASYRIAMHCSCFFAMPILFLCWGASSEGRPKAMASTVWGSISAQRWYTQCTQQYSAKLKDKKTSLFHVVTPLLRFGCAEGVASSFACREPSSGYVAADCLIVQTVIRKRKNVIAYHCHEFLVM